MSFLIYTYIFKGFVNLLIWVKKRRRPNKLISTIHRVIHIYNSAKIIVNIKTKKNPKNQICLNSNSCGSMYVKKKLKSSKVQVFKLSKTL